MTKLKKFFAAVLAAATVFTLSAAPVQAGYFPDVADPEESRAADTLAALGVVSGNENGDFMPGEALTRVAFCKMAIEIMGKGDQAKAQMNRTIFTDVPGTHWGRGYVNLAATMVVDESSNARLMTGVGNGKFEPNRNISYQEAVTLILRILGYASEAASSWPYGAIRTASELGLDEGLNIVTNSAAITRGQAARLFTRMLAIAPKGGDKAYAANLGTLVDDVIVLSTNRTVNGQSSWVTTSDGGFYRPAGVLDDSLVGQRGDALLDKNGHFVTLLVDSSSCVTVTLSRAPQASYLHTTAGTRYTVAGDTPVYVGTTGETSTYQEQTPNMKAGDVITVYLKDGKVIGLFRNVANAESSFVIVGTSPSAADFYPLTGNELGYTIRKNGSTIGMSEVKPYDVATYDPISKVITLCDVRLTCVYENAAPSLSAPATVTACGGNTFKVMANAMDTVAQFKLGQTFTLLFTADGQVASAVTAGSGWNNGIWSSGSNVSGNAMGVVSGDTVKLIGTNVTLKLDANNAKEHAGQLVSVSGSRGQVVLTALNLSYAAGNFDKNTMRLGNLTVSDSVQLYEQGGNGLTAVSLSSLPSSVPAAKIVGYRTNSSGRVDLIIFRSLTGDTYSYGLIEPTTRTEEVGKKGTAPYTPQEDGTYKDKDGNLVNAEGYLLNDKGEIIKEKQKIAQLKFITPTSTQTYDAAGGAVYSGFGTIGTYIEEEDGIEHEYAYVQSTLTAVQNAKSSDFYTVDGTTYVKVGSKTYEVASDVLCYNGAASTGWWSYDAEQDEYVYVVENQWFDSLLAARTFSNTLTLYVDSIGSKVRAVSAPAQ